MFHGRYQLILFPLLDIDEESSSTNNMENNKVFPYTNKPPTLPLPELQSGSDNGG